MRRNFNQLRSVGLTLAILVGSGALAGCHNDGGSDESTGTTAAANSNPTNRTESEIGPHEHLGAVPGWVRFANGDVPDRPKADSSKAPGCGVGDGENINDADRFTYRKHGKDVHATAADIRDVWIDGEHLTFTSGKPAAFITRQCITPEAPVTQFDNGWCIPVGAVNPQSEVLAVGAYAPNKTIAAQIHAKAPC